MPGSKSPCSTPPVCAMTWSRPSTRKISVATSPVVTVSRDWEFPGSRLHPGRGKEGRRHSDNDKVVAIVRSQLHVRSLRYPRIGTIHVGQKRLHVRLEVAGQRARCDPTVGFGCGSFQPLEQRDREDPPYRAVVHRPLARQPRPLRAEREEAAPAVDGVRRRDIDIRRKVQRRLRIVLTAAVHEEEDFVEIAGTVEPVRPRLARDVVSGTTPGRVRHEEDGLIQDWRASVTGHVEVKPPTDAQSLHAVLVTLSDVVQFVEERFDSSGCRFGAACTVGGSEVRGEDQPNLVFRNPATRRRSHPVGKCIGIVLGTGEIPEVGVGPDSDDNRPVILAHGVLRTPNALAGKRNRPQTRLATGRRVAPNIRIGMRRSSRSQEYCSRMNARSCSDSPAFSPIEKPSVVQVAGIGYIMIESGSSFVKLVSCALCGWNMFSSMTSAGQLFGGPERSRMTAARSQLMPPAGF